MERYVLVDRCKADVHEDVAIDDHERGLYSLWRLNLDLDELSRIVLGNQEVSANAESFL